MTGTVKKRTNVPTNDCRTRCQSPRAGGSPISGGKMGKGNELGPKSKKRSLHRELREEGPDVADGEGGQGLAGRAGGGSRMTGGGLRVRSGEASQTQNPQKKKNPPNHHRQTELQLRTPVDPPQKKKTQTQNNHKHHRGGHARLGRKERQRSAEELKRRQHLRGGEGES